MKKIFQNLAVDHMTFLVEPRLYKVTYALFRVVFGVEPEDIIYEKRRQWPGSSEEKSMTFAARIGEGEISRSLSQSIVAVVQPTEPAGQSSHVRQILTNRGGTAHWQHIALRTPDLLAFHHYALERGVNFLTPILKDTTDDLIQVFSGEWNMPGGPPSGIFFEFVQRIPSPDLLKKISESNREAWFRDRTFLGLYQEKENEYRGGKVTPFIDEALFEIIERLLASKNLWEITETDIRAVESAMLDYAKTRATRTFPSV
jgi:hypothetical protein